MTAPATPTPRVKALLFDVFGTVVDWRGTIVREGEAISRATGVAVDWNAFALAWHDEGYQGGMARVKRGELPWTTVGTLHRQSLEELLPQYGLAGLEEVEVAGFARVWRRLDPWPDAVPALTRLKRHCIIAPLSNGDFGMLVELAKHAGLPWDCVFTAELFGAYKPDPSTYQGAVRLLGLQPQEVMLVAAHAYDLRAAQMQGLRTAYVPRPQEYGEGHSPEPAEPDPSFDLLARDLLDLAEGLGAAPTTSL